MTLKTQRPIVLTNTCESIHDDELLIQAILWASPKFVTSKKKVFMNGQYPAVAIGKDKIHVHRLIAHYVYGGLKRDDYVHHLDGNKLNNILANLEIMSASKHQSITNKGRKQSEEHISKRIGAMAKTRYENPELIK